VTCDAKDPDTTFADIAPLQPPSGAPNLLILLDDVGFGASATFGGPSATPTADHLVHPEDRLRVIMARQEGTPAASSCAPARRTPVVRRLGEAGSRGPAGY
jgi:hypothetical protein